MVLTPTAGSTAATLSGAEGACDPGTLQQLQVADGGYACIVNGIASGGAVYGADNILVAISGVGVNATTPTQVQQALVFLLNSFTAR